MFGRLLRTLMCVLFFFPFGFRVAVAGYGCGLGLQFRWCGDTCYVNRLMSLRLGERCDHILLIVRLEVKEAGGCGWYGINWVFKDA
ncbi:hypothetical protein BDQ17DRAFT_1368162 [Cyathus striatus]|nr:hypothetical protein BDQ17DRAFT_1368162 [Cyathus striatus]